MRRTVRFTGTLLMVAGVLTLAWALLVWQWMDPFTGAYTKWKQHQLSSQYGQRAAGFRPGPIDTVSLASERRDVAREAKRYRRNLRPGDAWGRIRIPRLGLDMVLVNGTDHETLKRGPGRYLGSFVPGENRLVYVAGHRTTYLAPFSHIDDLRKGDKLTIEVPYGTFTYRISLHRIVTASQVSVLRSPRHERLILQACHPRFFATHRYLQFGQLILVEPRGAAPFKVPGASAAAAQESSR